MPNLSNITTAISSVSNLLLVSPQNTIGYQPQSPGTLIASGNPLVFHYEGEQSVYLESDITDHYIEDNSAIQDQIALRPTIISTHGFIGELNDIAPFFLQPLQAIANKLTTVSSYFPSLSATALLAYNEAAFAAATALNAVDSAISTVEAIGGAIFGGTGQTVINGTEVNTALGQNKQQTAFQQFYVWYVNNVLFTVQTPWAVFQNMAIKSLRSIQDETTNVITDFEVTFKAIRLASTITAAPQLNAAGRLALQGQSAVVNGNVSVSTVTPQIIRP